jgi:hypothetical protein
MRDERVGGAEGCGTTGGAGLQGVGMTPEQAARLVAELEGGGPVVVVGPDVPQVLRDAFRNRGVTVLDRLTKAVGEERERLAKAALVGDEVVPVVVPPAGGWPPLVYPPGFGPPPVSPAMRVPRGLRADVPGPTGNGVVNKLTPRPARACGGCDACCSTIGVRDVPGMGPKPAHTRCAHQSPSGCGIYEGRPQACRTYRCAWLEGQGDDGDRPDRAGLILDALGGMAVRAREVFRGAFDRARVKTRLRELHAAGLVVRLIPYKGRKLPVGKPL